MQNSDKLLELVRDYRPDSNPSTVEEFISSGLHQDFQNELLARIEQMRDFNEECKSNEYLETRGGIKALRLTMDIFHNILACRLADLESGEEEIKDEDL